MSSKLYTHIFIDLDDTLWDFERNAKASLRMVFDRFCLGDIFDTYLQFEQLYFEHNHRLWELYHHHQIEKDQLVVERFLNPLQLRGAGSVQQALAMNQYYLDSLADQKLLVDGAGELLEYLYAKYPLAIISNGFQEVQFRKLRNSGIERYFQKVILSEMVGVNKPDERIFSFALSQLNAPKESSLMIGDNPDADILGASRFGIDQIYFNPSGREVATIQPTFRVNTLQEITHIL